MRQCCMTSFTCFAQKTTRDGRSSKIATRRNAATTLTHPSIHPTHQKQKQGFSSPRSRVFFDVVLAATVPVGVGTVSAALHPCRVVHVVVWCRWYGHHAVASDLPGGGVLSPQTEAPVVAAEYIYMRNHTGFEHGTRGCTMALESKSED